MTKQQEVISFVRRIAREALADYSLWCDADKAKFVRENYEHLSRMVGDRLGDNYRFTELADIMEWKKTRVRR